MRTLSTRLFAVLLAVALAACSEVQDPVAPQADGEAREFFTIVRPKFGLYAEITAGAYHTCVRKTTGEVYCWGLDNLGQAGIGTSRTCAYGHLCIDQPRQVWSPSFSVATQVEAGNDHTCALTGSGAAFCWGHSNYGQLGAGLTGHVSEPIPVSGGIAFTSIAAGVHSTCATSASGMFCWGQLQNAVYGATIPQLVSSYNGYSRVTVGYLHACASYNMWGYRAADCWGNNRWGQVGFDPAAAINLPFTVGTGTGFDVNAVSTQGDFTCVDQGNTTVQCFGLNSWGTLGNGTTQNTHVAQTVGGGRALRGVSTGTLHACALDPNGAAWCWGYGYNGQLGNGVQSHFTSPVAVAMPSGVTFKAIAAGRMHSCALGNDDGIWCWGDNSYGQLGRGIWAASPLVPQRTSDPS